MTTPRRVIAITGAGGALGAAVSRRLAGEPDTDLVVSDVSQASLDATVAGLPSNSMIARCSGYFSASARASAISNSLNSNPGATVQPTSAYVDGSQQRAAHQLDLVLVEHREGVVGESGPCAQRRCGGEGDTQPPH